MACRGEEVGLGGDEVVVLRATQGGRKGTVRSRGAREAQTDADARPVTATHLS